MKNAVIALALAACSASAFAEQAPPFSLQCSNPKEGASVKWDGKDLNIAFSGELPKSSRTLAKPLSAFTTQASPPMVGSKEPRREYRLAFRTARPKTDASGKQEFATIFVLMSGRDVIFAALYEATMSGDTLFSTRESSFTSTCVTTLKP